jgi:hypothetical protein
MNKNNRKVPIAILGCFLIAFIIQGVLKFCGILVFEKALDWGIFSIIDNSKTLQCIIYPIFVCLTIYCLSFALTTKPYSTKWFHYVLIVIFGYASTIYKLLIVDYSYKLDIMIDVIIYIILPFVINITNSNDKKLFKNNIYGIITSLSMHILMYCAYLGLSYWSGLLTSLLPIKPVYLSSSTHFLIRLEIYIGLITFMLSMNSLINYIKEVINMYRPFDIASDEAKQKEIEEIENKKEGK